MRILAATLNNVQDSHDKRNSEVWKCTSNNAQLINNDNSDNRLWAEKSDNLYQSGFNIFCFSYHVDNTVSFPSIF